MPAHQPDPESLEIAARLVQALEGRAVVSEAVGVLQGWQGCDFAQALDGLSGGTGQAGREAEAARIAAIVDAQADGTADPDYGGWA
ncbi:hypothetical protein DMH01_36015 [Amycolatopsis sp. WAC 04182]|uniref:ANTAR domain-containing protein n=1 Tax=Amycolatopsis sp. WAC 04182 TaxID=2203198 RepID=UPI000F790F3F|nr:ANTAR domain-containing protein [Amycolatopsis sp. WAC 04182]RSN54596.1 hypothetical protein DMH01_36015 [Amycolatopsis sp. WAC 04182]